MTLYATRPHRISTHIAAALPFPCELLMNPNAGGGGGGGPDLDLTTPSDVEAVRGSRADKKRKEANASICSSEALLRQFLLCFT